VPWRLTSRWEGRVPRKKGPEARADEQAVRHARLRYLLRNPTFRSEFNQLRQVLQQIPVSDDGTAHPADASRFARIAELRSKWSLDGISYSILFRREYPDLVAENVPYFESLLGAPGVRNPFYPPVGSRFLRPGVLAMYVDLNHPADLLVALTEDQLRKAISVHHSGDGKPAPRHRRRLDRVDYYLQVYDLSEKGAKFGSIAKTLHRPVSSVKVAFLAARRNIFGPAYAPTKKGIVLESFDAENHMKTCSVCKRAETFDQLCMKAKLWVNQDTKGQVELTGLDTVEG
jgi:hypothetical protein